MYLVGSEVALYSPSLDDAGNGTSTLTDLVGSNDGTITGATWVTDTEAGGFRALEFSNDYVTVSDSSDFAFGTDPFWFSVWFKLTSTSQQAIIDKGYNTGNPSRIFFILLDSTTYRIYPGDTPAALDFTASGYLNNWVNVIFQRQGAVVTAWVNGTQALQKTNLLPSKVLTNTDILSLGSRADQAGIFTMSGRLDDTRFGTGVLSSEDIANLSSQRVYQPVGAEVTRGLLLDGLHVDFGGRTNRIRVPSVPGFTRTAQCSFSCWFRLTGDPATSAHWFFNHAQTPSQRIGARLRSGSGAGIVDFGTYNGSSYFGVSSNRTGFNDDGWHFVTFVNNAGTLSIFIDGVDVTTTGTISGLSYLGSPGGHIGWQNNGSIVSYHHQLDSRYYSRLITLPEHQLMFEQGLNPKTYNSSEPIDSLLARYQMQDNYSGTVYDSSGNGRHASWESYDSAVWQTHYRIPWSPAWRIGHGAGIATGQVHPRDDSATTEDIFGNPLLFDPENGGHDSYPKKWFSIGNSLTADANPGVLARGVGYVINTGEGLTYHASHPNSSTSTDSFLWGDAAVEQTWDVLMLQPFPETPLQTLQDDLDNCQTIISAFDATSPPQTIIIHEGFAPAASVEAGTRINNQFDGEFDYSDAYFEALLKGLRGLYPGRDIRRSQTNRAVWIVKEDLDAGTNPLLAASGINAVGGGFTSNSLYRDGLHMNYLTGRYLINQTLRRCMNMPFNSGTPWENHPNYGTLSAAKRAYINNVVRRVPFEKSDCFNWDRSMCAGGSWDNRRVSRGWDN